LRALAVNPFHHYTIPRTDVKEFFENRASPVSGFPARGREDTGRGALNRHVPLKGYAVRQKNLS
jgi:hypothetical protein